MLIEIDNPPVKLYTCDMRACFWESHFQGFRTTWAAPVVLAMFGNSVRIGYTAHRTILGLIQIRIDPLPKPCLFNSKFALSKSSVLLAGWDFQLRVINFQLLVPKGFIGNRNKTRSQLMIHSYFCSSLKMTLLWKVKYCLLV